MKRLADRGGKKHLHSGYFLFPCDQCGLVVVHSMNLQRPLHMHARSQRCRDLAAARAKEPVTCDHCDAPATGWFTSGPPESRQVTCRAHRVRMEGAELRAPSEKSKRWWGIRSPYWAGTLDFAKGQAAFQRALRHLLDIAAFHVTKEQR